MEFCVSGGSRERRIEIGAARSERTKQRLIEAAARVIGLRGEESATIDDFIQAAGVSRGTFYKHFPTRHDMMTALWEHFGREPYRRTWDAYAHFPDAAERVVVGIKHQLLRATATPAWGWLVIRIWIDENAMYRDIQTLVLGEIQAGIEQGSFIVTDKAAAGELVLGALMGATKAVLTAPQSADFIQTVCLMILCMLGINMDDARQLATMRIPDVPAIRPFE